MTIRQLVYCGDSIPAGYAPFTAITYGQGGKGSYQEIVTALLAAVMGIGPLVGSGLRGVWRQWTPGDEVAFTGSKTDVTTSDAFDKAPYGNTSVGAQPTLTYANGSTNIWTWTKPALTPAAVGFSIDYVAMSAAVPFAYRINGGSWTNHSETLHNDNAIWSFYVASAAAATVDIKASNVANTGVNTCPLGVSWFYLDPTSAATSGLIVHNLSVNTTRLHDLVAVSTSGNRTAFWTARNLGTGWGSTTMTALPNAGTVVQHLNDGLINNTTTEAADFSTCYGIVSACGPVGFISDYECTSSYIGTTPQSDLRATAASSAASLGAKYLSLYVWLANNGYTGNAASAPFLNVDLIHPNIVGHAAFIDPIYWFIRNNFFSSAGAAATVYPVSAARPAVAYSGKCPATAATAAPIAVIPV